MSFYISFYTAIFQSFFLLKLMGFHQICIMLCADHGPCVSGAHNTIVTARAGKDLVSSLVSGNANSWTRLLPKSPFFVYSKQYSTNKNKWCLNQAYSRLVLDLVVQLMMLLDTLRMQLIGYIDIYGFKASYMFSKLLFNVLSGSHTLWICGRYEKEGH